MILKFKISLLTLLFSTGLMAQVTEVNPPEYIKTITFKGSTAQSQLPILRLG